MLAKNGIKRMKTHLCSGAWLVSWLGGPDPEPEGLVALYYPGRRRGVLPGVGTHHTGRLGESPRFAGRCCMHGVIRLSPGETRIVTAPGDKARRVPAPRMAFTKQAALPESRLTLDGTRRCLGERDRGECEGRWMRW